MRSPYNLLQEIYPTRWKMIVCCIMLNRTSRKQVDSIRKEFFKRWPNPKAAMEANTQEMADLIKGLGFKNRRTNTIIRMSRDFVSKKWKDPTELYGVGQYANDSYDIFILKKIVENPSDKVLKKYVKWKQSKGRFFRVD